jgi:hypothetical protein
MAASESVLKSFIVSPLLDLFTKLSQQRQGDWHCWTGGCTVDDVDCRVVTYDSNMCACFSHAVVHLARA